MQNSYCDHRNFDSANHAAFTQNWGGQHKRKRKIVSVKYKGHLSSEAL
jgi:hypothetical protein